jgi:hypothetical protein
MNGSKLVVAAALTSLALVVFLWIRVTQAQDTCGVIKVQVERTLQATGHRGTPGYAYYQEHPDELRAARASSQQLLDKLPC